MNKMLNPNCSEIVWRLNIKRSGKNEYSTDTSTYPNDSLNIMIDLLEEAKGNIKGETKDLRKKIVKALEGIKDVEIEFVDNSGGGGHWDTVEKTFKIAKACVQGKITREKAEELDKKCWDNDGFDVDKVLNPNCSEAVFRFHTTEPKQMQEILQTIADEINNNSTIPVHQNQKVPLFKEAEQYDTDYEPKDLRKKIVKALENEERNVLIKDCAGLGDNDAVIKVNKEKKYFTLNIGNNDISENTTGWVETIKSMGIKVEEAETCEELKKIARDCCCGIVFGF